MQSETGAIIVPFVSNNVIAWLIACVTALWFGFLAAKAGKNRALWALAGGLFGLVSTTFVFGLGSAMAIPFSDREKSALYVEWTLLALAINALVGGFFTWSIRRKSASEPAPPPAPGPAGEKKTEKRVP